MPKFQKILLERSKLILIGDAAFVQDHEIEKQTYHVVHAKKQFAIYTERKLKHFYAPTAKIMNK